MPSNDNLQMITTVASSLSHINTERENCKYAEFPVSELIAWTVCWTLSAPKIEAGSISPPQQSPGGAAEQEQAETLESHPIVSL